jgi:voltage-gated potassium channel
MTGSASLRHRIYLGLEIGLAGRGPVRWLHGFIILLILANVAAVVLESYPPYMEAFGRGFWWFEVFSVCVFTVEYVARLWSIVESQRYHGISPSSARIRYALSPMALIDLAAILPFYLAFLVPVDLRFLRVLRLLRLLKLSHYFPGLDVFLFVLRVQLPALIAASLVMLVLILFSACLMFILENEAQPEAFSTVGESIWWSVVTLTTVGYGDVTPVTPLGKLLGAVIMLLGVGTVALPAAMLAGRFSEEIQNRRGQLEHLVSDMIDDGKLESSEREEIDRVGRELGIPAETVQQIVSNQRSRLRAEGVCPHCGKKLHRVN